MRGGRGQKKLGRAVGGYFFWIGFFVRGCGGFERLMVMGWLEKGVVYRWMEWNNGVR